MCSLPAYPTTTNTATLRVSRDLPPHEENGLQIRRYWSSACPHCPTKEQCTPSPFPAYLTLRAQLSSRGRATQAQYRARSRDASTTHDRARMRNLEGRRAHPHLGCRATSARKSACTCLQKPEAGEFDPRYAEEDEGELSVGCEAAFMPSPERWSVSPRPNVQKRAQHTTG